MGINEFACSRFDVGGGQVKTAHGVLPVPAPATAELLRGAPTYSSGIERELVTPTGAAIATTLATRYAAIPPMTLRTIGYGAGSTDLKEKANVMRLLIGDSDSMGTAESEFGGRWDSPVTVIETNLDDEPADMAILQERGARGWGAGCFSTPVQMKKKNRPGQLVTILSEPENVT